MDAHRARGGRAAVPRFRDRKSTRLNSSHTVISYAVFCLKKKKKKARDDQPKGDLPLQGHLVKPNLHHRAQSQLRDSIDREEDHSHISACLAWYSAHHFSS